MDRKAYVHKRKRKYMAQVLERFEKDIEPQLTPGDARVESFKALVRARVNALAVDACDVMGDDEVNQAGQDLRDRLDPEGRP